MRRIASLILVFVAALFSGSCSFKGAPQEPRTLKAVTDHHFKQDESKLNATYSYLVFLYHNNKGEVDIARRALDQAMAEDPDSKELKFEQAQDLFLRGLYASAREQLLKLKDDNEEAEKLYIQVLVHEGNLSEARVALDNWLKKDPKDEESFALRVRIEVEEQNTVVADNLLKRFLKEIPDSSQAYLLRGRVRQMQNKEKLALADYKTSLELDPQNVAAAAHLAFLQDLMGKQDDALQTYSWLADLTDNPEFHKRLGNLYLERSDPRRAIAALEAYARHQPNDNQNLARLAALYIEIKDYEQAEYKLVALLKQQPDNESLHYYHAAALFELGKKAQALDEIRKVKRESSLYPERLRIELESLWDLGQEGSAKTVAETAAGEAMEHKQLTDESTFSVLYTFMAQKKMKDSARDILDKGLAIYPKSAQLRYNHALALDEDGKSNEALKLGQQLLKEDSKNPALQNLVGYLMASQGLELNKAEKLIEAALKARPTDPFIIDSKAWIKYKQNRLPEALGLLQAIQKEKPDEPIILIHLGDVLAKLGRIQEAVALYEKALSLGIDAVTERVRVQAIVSKTPAAGQATRQVTSQ